MLIAGANGSAESIDQTLYKSNKHNRATVHVGFNSIFWRSKKDNKKAIFRIAFIHEIIGVSLAILATTILIVTLITKEALMMNIGAALLFFVLIYGAYCQILNERIKSNLNRKNK